MVVSLKRKLFRAWFAVYWFERCSLNLSENLKKPRKNYVSCHTRWTFFIIIIVSLWRCIAVTQVHQKCFLGNVVLFWAWGDLFFLYFRFYKWQIQHHTSIKIIYAKSGSKLYIAQWMWKDHKKRRKKVDLQRENMICTIYASPCLHFSAYSNNTSIVPI